MLIQGDAAHIPLADESVQCVVTSPPYWGLRSYGLPPLVWDMPEDAICRKSDHIWGDDLISAQRNRNKQPGSTLRDGTGEEWTDSTHMLHPSQGNFCLICGAWRGSLGLEPTPELYVEHIVAVFREVRRVLRKDGTVWLNLGDSYASRLEGHGGFGNWATGGSPKPAGGTVSGVKRKRNVIGLKPKDLCGIPWRVALALQADGWWLRSDIIWHKPNPMPESVTDRPTRAHEYVFLLVKSKRYFYDADAVKEPIQCPQRYRYGHADHYHDGNSDPKGGGFRGKGGISAHYNAGGQVPAGRNRRTVWRIATQAYSGAHFATFPEALVEPCILAGTSAHGCCPECGAPWERATSEASGGAIGKSWHTHDFDDERGNAKIASSVGYQPGHTIGWRPTCVCYRPQEQSSTCPQFSLGWLAMNEHAIPKPCVVLDPFCGTATVGVVCAKHRRRFVGLDLSWPYLAKLATERLGKPMAVRLEGL